MNWRELITKERILFLALTGAIFVFSRQIATALLPFITALVLAALLEPIVQIMQQRLHMPRPAAVMTTLITAVVITGYICFNMAGKIITELVDLATLLPLYREEIIEISDDVFAQFERLNESLPPVVSLNIQRSLEDFLKTMEVATRDLINRVLAAFASLPIFLLVTLVTLVSTYFISKDKELLAKNAVKLFPESWQQRIGVTQARISVDIMGFVKGRLLLLLIATTLAGAGLVLLQVRYWVIVAIVIGVLDNIPAIGPGIIFTPWVAIAVVTGDTDRAVFLTILYILIFAARQLVEPKIMGDSVGIHPLAMLLAMYGGIVFFGVLGIFVGPLLAILIKAAINAGLFSQAPHE